MQRIIGLIIIIALFFQISSFGALASISQDEAIMQQTIMHEKMNNEEDCQLLRNMMMVNAKVQSMEKQCNLFCNLISSPYLPANAIVTKKIVWRHDYIQFFTNIPKQNYHILLEKPPKTLVSFNM